MFGIYLHFGEDSHFWINLGIQALATLWILQLVLRVFGLTRPSRLAIVSGVLMLTTALPWLASMLLTDIFAGLSVLSLFILVLHGDRISTAEKIAAVRVYGLCRRDPQRDARRCCSGCAAAAGSRGRGWAGASPFPDCCRAA